MICTGNRVNAAFIPENFDRVLIAIKIMILSPILVEAIHLAYLWRQPRGVLCGSGALEWT